MSKDVIIAGVVVTACLALVGVAFLGGSGSSERKPSLASTGARNELTGFSQPPDFPPPAPAPAPLPPPGPAFPPIDAPPPAGTTPAPAPGPTPPPSPNDDLFAPIPTVPTPTPPTGAVPPTVPGAFGDVPPATATGDTATTAVTSAAAGVSGGGTHTVKANETLGDISSIHYKTSRHWKKILDANPGVDPTNLKIGQTLAIPAVAADRADGAHASGDGTYIVQHGDSYYAIAKKHLGSASRWREIEKLNKIPAEELTPGQKIKLPPKGGSAEGGKGWVVEEGDTLGEISKKHYGTTQVVDQIIAANPGVDPTHLKPGQHLVLPEAKVANVHVVEKGDTLGEISKLHYGTTTKWKDIVKANPGIDAEALKVGTRLILPGKPVADAGSKPHGDATRPAPAAGTPAAAPELASGEYYTVQKGDLLATIAKKQLGSAARWQEILDANPGINPNNLRLGQKLRLPGKGAAAPVPGPAPLPEAGAPPVPGAAPAPRAPEPVDDLFAPIPVSGPAAPAAPAGAPAPRPDDNLGLRL